MDAQAMPIELAEVGETGRVLDYPTTPVATEELQILIATVEHLLLRVHAAADSELGRMRARTANALARAKVSAARYAAQMREEGTTAKEGGRNVEVRERAWIAAGFTALLALSIGLYAGRSFAAGSEAALPQLTH